MHPHLHLPGRALVVQQARPFYTHHLPKRSMRLVLEDGSVLVSKRATTKPGATTTTTPSSSSASHLPPLVRSHPPTSAGAPCRQLGPEEVRSIRALRQADPDQWTVGALAKRFHVPPLLILQLAPASVERRELATRLHESYFDALPFRNKRTILDRIRRKALW
jgi:hypothetical protein